MNKERFKYLRKCKASEIRKDYYFYVLINANYYLMTPPLPGEITKDYRDKVKEWSERGMLYVNVNKPGEPLYD